MYRFAWSNGEYIKCIATESLRFFGIDKVMFFSENFYVKVDKEETSYYGTYSFPLPSKFRRIEKWTLEVERELYYEIIKLGIVKGIASMYPVSEERE